MFKISVPASLRSKLLKLSAGFLEKASVGALMLGVFQDNDRGLTIGLTALALAYVFTALEDKL